METWMKVYAKHLHAQITTHPEKFAWAVAQFDEMLAKMRVFFLQGAYLKDSVAIKLTCKEFKIPHTYKAINAFIANHE